jgi:hypothetical protein
MLKASFDFPEKSKEARNKLLFLRKSGSVADYVINFNLSAEIAGIKGVVLKQQF